MRTFMMLALPALLAGALPIAAQAQARPEPTPSSRQQPDRQPAPAATPTRAASAHSAPTRSGPTQSGSAASRYGQWNSAWGKAPPAPPAHFTKVNDWHRHVRACQQRFRSYTARTDSYRTHSGKLVHCKL